MVYRTEWSFSVVRSTALWYTAWGHEWKVSWEQKRYDTETFTLKCGEQYREWENPVVKCPTVTDLWYNGLATHQWLVLFPVLFLITVKCEHFYTHWSSPDPGPVQCEYAIIASNHVSTSWEYDEKWASILLLDKVGCVVIGDFQMDQHHLMLKELHMRPYMVTKRRCVWNKTFLLGPIVWNKVISCFISPLFIMFLYSWNAHKS